MSAIAGSVEPECLQSECLERLDEVADLYAAHAVRVRRLVGLNVHASEAVLDDACQVAWLRLVRHPGRVRREAATRWLVRVAVREAWRSSRRGARELSLDELAEESAAAPPSAPELMDELAEQHARLDAIRRLPPRQQRLVWLHGLGFSYEEMAVEIGATRRTVERQLLRARSALAQAQA